MGKRTFTIIAEQVFHEIFQDYADTDSMWLDFGDYQKRAHDRIDAILWRHRRALANLIIHQHYENVNKDGNK
jgi:hypothetical protein